MNATICEADRLVSKTWGVTAEAVAAARIQSLEEGSGFERKKKGGAVVYTAAGLQRLAVVLGLDPSATGAVVLGFDEKEGGGFPPPAVPVRERLRLMWKLPNPTFVRVRTPDNRVADVRVRNSGLLKVGVLLECELRGAAWVCVHPGIAPVH